MCRCKERGEALGRSVGAALKGDLSAVRRELGFVARTGAEDAAALARRTAQQAARLRLAGRR
jgi:hypothetical protein